MAYRANNSKTKLFLVWVVAPLTISACLITSHFYGYMNSGLTARPWSIPSSIFTTPPSSSRTKVVANRVELKHAFNNRGTEVLSIPDIGKVRVENCDDATGAMLKFINTQPHDVHATGSVFYPTPILAPGTGDTLSDSLNNFVISYGSGSDSVIANVTVAMNNYAASCSFQAQATVTYN